MLTTVLTGKRAVVGSLLTVLPLSILALTGCTQAKEEAKSPSVATAPSPTSQPAGGRADLKGDCSATGEKWSLKGTIKNPDKTEQEYTVLAAVAKTDGGTVLGSKEVKVKVKAGESAPVEAADFYTHQADGLQCVIRVTKAPVSN